MQTLTKPKKVWTNEALEALPKGKGKFELIDGKLTRLSPAKGNHGFIAARLVAAVPEFCYSPSGWAWCTIPALVFAWTRKIDL